MTTILTKKKDTTGAPAPGDLTNAAGGAELAVNTFDKRLYTKDSGGNVVEIGTNPTILNIDNIEINGNTISSTNSNGDINLSPNGTGTVVINTDLDVDNININGNTIISTNSNGDINLTPNGTGTVVVSKLQVTGTFQLDGNVTVGDSSADTLTVNSTITSNLIFTDNTYDIGASGATRPRTGYFGTSVISPLFVAGAGTVSAPAITTTGDLNTGIFFPAADTIAFTEGGVESMRIDSSGNVGIGATSVTAIGTNYTTVAINGSNGGGIQMQSGGVSRGNVYADSTAVYLGSATNIPLLFAVNTAEVARIDTSGRLLVGTSSSIVGGAGQFALNQGGGNIPSINVIGTNLVGGGGREVCANFTVITNDTGSVYSSVAQIASAKENGTQGNTAGYLSFKTLPNGGSLTERMRIDSSGNLGVGTLPSCRGDFRGTSGLGIKFQETSSGNSNRIELGTGSGIGYINADAGVGSIVLGLNVAGTERMRIDSSGNVGIGTSSPNTTAANRIVLDVNGTTSALYNISTGGTRRATFYSDSTDCIFGSVTSIPLEFLTGGVERMRITSGGSVGIGVTPNTANRLEVKGADSASGTTSLSCTNSNGTNQLYLRNDNYFNSGAIANYSLSGTALVIDGSNFVGKTTSSLRYKKDIVDYDKGLDAIAKLRPVYYKSAIEGPHGFDPKPHAGFIAEEIAEEGFEEFLIRNQDGEPDAIQYSQMTALLCKAIQEQQAMIEELKAEVTLLKSK